MARRPGSMLDTLGHWVTGRALGPADPPEAAPDPFDPRFWGAFTAATAAGQTVTSASGMQLAAVQAVMEALAGPISSLPLMVFERTGPKSKRPAPEHPLYRILHTRPNARQTAQEYRDDQQRQLAWHRNCLSIIRPAPDGYPIGELEPVHWTRVMRVHRSSDGRVYYDVRRLGGLAGWDTYRDDEVVHIRKAPLSDDGLVGLPVYQTARDLLGSAQAVAQFGALYFGNGGSGGGVLKHPGNFRSTDDRDAFLEGWRSGGAGLNRHKDRLLLFGVDYTPFAVNNDEAQFIETRKQVGYELVALWNMPPHRVGMLERATNNNIEQQSIEFVVYTIAPYVAAWEQGLGRDLLIGEDQDRYFVEFNIGGLLRGDIKTRWTAYAQGRQWGWLCVDDIRELEGLDPLADGQGQLFLTPQNMSPVGRIGDDGQPVDDPNADDAANPPGA